MWRPWETSQSATLFSSDSSTSIPKSLGNSLTSPGTAEDNPATLEISYDIPVYNRFSMFMKSSEPDYEKVEEYSDETASQPPSFHPKKVQNTDQEQELAEFDCSVYSPQVTNRRQTTNLLVYCVIQAC